MVSLKYNSVAFESHYYFFRIFENIFFWKFWITGCLTFFLCVAQWSKAYLRLHFALHEFDWSFYDRRWSARNAPPLGRIVQETYDPSGEYHYAPRSNAKQIYIALDHWATPILCLRPLGHAVPALFRLLWTVRLSVALCYSGGRLRLWKIRSVLRLLRFYESNRPPLCIFEGWAVFEAYR